MDELTLVREIGADTPEPETLALRRARKQLLTASEREQRPRVRRPLIRVAAAAAAVALVAGGVVVGETFWRDGSHRVVASADAVDVLDRAAKAELAQNDPVVGPDKYLKVAFKEQYLGEGEGADGNRAAWLEEGRQTLYVPGDPDRDWVLELTARRIVDVYIGDPVPSTGSGETLRARDGAFYHPLGEDWGSPSPDFLDSLPRDRDELRDRLYDDSAGGGQSVDGEALVYIADLLRSGRVPADLRVALFEVAKTIPGVTVTDDAVVLDGRRGVAIGRTEGENGVRTELVFDRQSGLLIGERGVTTTDRFLPVGTVTTSTAVSASVVDEAP
ncbi:CU044_5270 family protein [Nocardioides speluncae]|uniref:CU044_5270 family protein n=1 Tax=Nocardioides speluncae TaxID=2670337 RepID=UPI000D69B6B2|nr:CU044_5270 family protein [Nocardioides speluncae]